MTTAIAKVVLAPRERQVLEGLADGSTIAVVAIDLKIRQGTAAGYLKLAKRKLYGVSENAAALAVAYTTSAIGRPELLNPEALNLSQGQREIVPLIAREMTAKQMVTELKRPIDIIRQDGRDLLTNLQARNRAHAITRAWQYQILTADQVITWLR